MSNALMLIDTFELDVIGKTLNKIAQFQALIQGSLRKDHDYGIISGTDKPTLYQAGAQKVNMMFGINPVYEIIDKIIDYSIGLIEYQFKCTLYKDGQPVSEGVGSCSSYEKKYRYINVEEKNLPVSIDKSTLTPIKDKYGRTKYKIQNPDIADLNNTILKMAKKRAYVDATLQVAALGDLFTQDLEDMKDYLQNEQAENMTTEEAAGLKINFGKHKGKTLGDLYKNEPDWIKWFIEKGTDEVIKKAIQILANAAKEHHEKLQAQKNTLPDKQEKKEENVDEDTGKISEFEKEILAEHDKYAGTPFEGK